jgi:hypothetical protein
LTQAVQARKTGKQCEAKSGIRFLTGLCLICCGLLLPVLSASGLVVGGITVESNVILGGNNVLDSFDSSNPSHSMWHSNLWFQGHNFGTYTNAKRTDQIVVGTDSSILTFNAGVVIYGYVDTAPGGSVSVSNGCSVGDQATWIGPNPQSPWNTGIQPNHARDDMNVIFDDAVLPIPTNSLNPTAPGVWYSTGYYPLGTNIDGNTYYYLVTNVPGLITSPTNKVFYSLWSIANNSASIFIDASNCVLYLPNGISMKSGNNLTLNVTNNANVEIYTGGTLDTGNGAINNAYQYAPTFKIFGLPTCNSIIFPGNASLTAWIYAPDADVTFSGGGSNPYDIAGAFMVHSVALKGNFHFHFDQVLKILQPPYRYVADDWQEVH